MPAPSKKLNQHTRATFVRKGVEENSVTTSLINSLMPYYPKEAQVIGGYVDDSDQYWKVNFHWEYLQKFLDKALAMEIDDKYKENVKAIKAVLDRNKPKPSSGYTSSSVMGTPKDKSTNPVATIRWKAVRQSKRDFKIVMDKAGLLEGLSDKKKKQWQLAVAPVAKPGTSKHSTGYALDIKIRGKNEIVSTISKSLGASLVYDEASHVHVEFNQGANVQIIKSATANRAALEAIQYQDQKCILTPSEIVDLKAALQKVGDTSYFLDEIPCPQILSTVIDEVKEWFE